jgi:hypothetical protein
MGKKGIWIGNFAVKMDTRMVPHLIALIRRIHGALYVHADFGQGLPQECHHSLAIGLLRGTCSTTPEPLCFGLGGAPGALSGAFPVQERLLLLAPSTTRFASSHPLRNKRRVGRGMGRRTLWGPRSSTLIRGQGACERGLRDAHGLPALRTNRLP